MRVNRNVKAKCLTLLDKFPILAILGARQVGKTELSKELGAGWRYIDVEDPDDFELLSRDPKFFFERNPQEVIFDEAQLYPELFARLRGVVDSNRSQKGRFILTGSSSPELIKSISESLAGRIGIVELGTLKFNEFFGEPLSPFYSFFTANKLSKDLPDSLSARKPQVRQDQLLDFWFRGGYPEPTLSKGTEFWSLWMQNYFKTYIERDLRALFPRLDTVRYRRFIQMLSHVSGTTVVKRDLAQSVEVSESSIKDYLEIADATFVWRNLSSFEHQIKKEVFKMPRGHFRDSGLAHYLLKIRSLEELESHPTLGRSFESFVIEEIIKGLEATTITGWTAHYYRTRAKSEIDLVLHGPFGVVPIEIKYGSQVREQKISTLTTFVKEHNLPFGILVNNSKTIEWLNRQVVQIPLAYL